MVVRYDYLWSVDKTADDDQGKHRPTFIVATGDSDRFVVLLPITHTPPADDTVGIEIPEPVGAAVGLDDARSWIIVSEYNVDEWPNPGLTPAPNSPNFYYGFLPPKLFKKIKEAFLDLRGKDQSTRVDRLE